MEIKKLKELKERKWLYKQMEEYYEQFSKKEDSEIKKRYLALKEKKKQAVENIEAHEKEYL